MLTSRVDLHAYGQVPPKAWHAVEIEGVTGCYRAVLAGRNGTGHEPAGFVGTHMYHGSQLRGQPGNGLRQ